MSKDPESLPSPAFIALRAFANEHSPAIALEHIATRDYAAARCLLNNLLLTGLMLGAQAIEKFLKAYLLFNDPKRDVKRLSHDLPKLLGEVEARYPGLRLSQYAPLITRFSRYYDARYPDNPNVPASMTSAELAELDQLIVLLNENMPCPLNVKMRTGFYAEITFSLGIAGTVTPTEFWIKNGNNALTPLLPRIADDYGKVMKELYP
jgi:HEPN domain-containing protein